MKVLIVNHKEQNCGVYQFGKRVYTLAKESQDVVYYYCEVSSQNEYSYYVETLAPDCVIFNWHSATARWLTPEIVNNTPAKKYFIYHDETLFPVYDKYLFFGGHGDVNNVVSKSKKVELPRPLFGDLGITYPVNTIPTFGSFGFGLMHKGFTSIVTLVQDSFDEAVINLHIPPSHFCDAGGGQARAIADMCRNLIVKPGIKLNATHDFRTDFQVLEFLAGNDLNMFLYQAEGGLSSVIDYALSVHRPIAISDSKMFAHILKDEIRVSQTNIKTILANSVEPLIEYYIRWSKPNFIAELDRCIKE